MNSAVTQVEMLKVPVLELLYYPDKWDGKARTKGKKRDLSGAEKEAEAPTYQRACPLKLIAALEEIFAKADEYFSTMQWDF